VSFGNAVMGVPVCGVRPRGVGRVRGGASRDTTSAQRKSTTSADLAEVAGMVLVEHDAVVVLATSITATARMLPVLADTSVAGTDMAPLLAVLAETCAAANTVVKTSAIALAGGCRLHCLPSPKVGVGGQAALLFDG